MALVEGKLSVDFRDDDMPDFRFDDLINRYGDKIEALVESELLLAKSRIQNHFRKNEIGGTFTVETKVG